MCTCVHAPVSMHECAEHPLGKSPTCPYALCDGLVPGLHVHPENWGEKAGGREKWTGRQGLARGPALADSQSSASKEERAGTPSWCQANPSWSQPTCPLLPLLSCLLFGPGWGPGSPGAWGGGRVSTLRPGGWLRGSWKGSTGGDFKEPVQSENPWRKPRHRLCPAAAPPHPPFPSALVTHPGLGPSWACSQLFQPLEK